MIFGLFQCLEKSETESNKKNVKLSLFYVTSFAHEKFFSKSNFFLSLVLTFMIDRGFQSIFDLLTKILFTGTLNGHNNWICTIWICTITIHGGLLFPSNKVTSSQETQFLG